MIGKMGEYRLGVLDAGEVHDAGASAVGIACRRDLGPRRVASFAVG